MISSSLKSAEGSCGAYIDAAAERQAIRRHAAGGPAGRRYRELQQFHEREPILKRLSRFHSVSPS
jgi:hypothetical protein